MEKYYLIPMTDDDVYLGDKTLKSILDSSNHELVQREKERIDILYSVSPVFKMPEYIKRKYEEYCIETKRIYDKLQVPYYLIAYGNDESAEEIVTKSKITPKYPAALGIRRVSKELAEEYYIIKNYKTKIERYFNCIDNICENYFGFNDTYEIEGYIEGKIGEKNVKGIFNGKVRVKRIELNN